MRHAKAEPYADDDRERRLTARGRTDAAAAGQQLAAWGVRPDHGLVSAAARTVETWELVKQALDCRPVEEYDEELYVGSAGAVLETLRGVSDEHRTVVLVGHNPGLEDLVNRLTGAWVEMVTSAIAVIDLPGGWAGAGEEPAATLRTSGRPPS
jgi:phosphohistidine phosphatase